MTRTTRDQVDGITERLADALGVPYVHYKDASSLYGAAEGTWCLDYSSAYGGWVVVAVSGSHGGQSRPLGDRRRSASEHWDAVHLALAALALIAAPVQS